MDSFMIIETEESFESEKTALIESGDYSESDLFYKIDGSACTSKSSFFNHFSQELDFPDYFSNNWDSFMDCLQDSILSEGKNVAIYIEHMDQLLRQDLRSLYLFYDALYNFRENSTEALITIYLNFNQN